MNHHIIINIQNQIIISWKKYINSQINKWSNLMVKYIPIYYYLLNYLLNYLFIYNLKILKKY